ncbi:transcription antitermination factor NusB [bacterium]|nr:transcription antitermination factor NusB [bacterium]
MRKRRLSRELALQILFALDIDGKISLMDSEQFYQIALEQLGFLSPEIAEPGQNLSYLLISGVFNNLSQIDSYIENASDNWTVKRLSVIDRNILRIAVFEMAYVPELPPRVAINEAIEISKNFATDNSPKFINDVLDRICRILKVKSRGAMETEEGKIIE